MPRKREVNALTRQRRHVDRRLCDYLRLLSDSAGLQNLIDGVMQPVGIREHDVVEAAPLLVAQRTRLQRLEIEADRCNRRLQLVGDGVDEGVVLLVAAYLEHEEDGVDDQSGDDKTERDDTEEDDAKPRALGGDDDPADVQRD